MIQCNTFLTTPFDDEPDPIQEAEIWLKRHPEATGNHLDSVHLIECKTVYARTVIEMLLAYIKDEI